MDSADREKSSDASARDAGSLAGRTIVLAVTGSIAAYKAVELARLLLKAGARVLPVMTTSAARFLGPVTLSGITGHPVETEMWDASGGERHVRLAEEADAVAIVPATADVIARLAHGRADDLVAALALCARGPVLVAPAMHPRMWAHAATQRNVAQLAAMGRTALIGPVLGEVASGNVGVGRMADPEAIARAIDAALSPRDFPGARFVVTAGPTVEDIDPVRFIGNRSSGRMGFAVAERAAARGAEVTLVAGPVALGTPDGVRRIDVRSALAMRDVLWQQLGPDLSRADALIMCAAVADHRPAAPSATKNKKGHGDGSVTLELVANPDLLAEVGAARRAGGSTSRPVLVGFAVETAGGDALLDYARRKLVAKQVDLIVANEAAESFGREDNRATLVSREAAEELPRLSKSALADRVLDQVRALLRA